MTMRMAQIIAAGSLAVCLALNAGCNSRAQGRSILTTQDGDRMVKATLDGGGFISSQGGVCIITCGAGKIAVEKEAVKLDGKEIAKLPADAKTVVVDYTNGKLTITADDKSIPTADPR